MAWLWNDSLQWLDDYRQTRKKGQSASLTPIHTHDCSGCDRSCLSAIGLISHRTEREANKKQQQQILQNPEDRHFHRQPVIICTTLLRSYPYLDHIRASYFGPPHTLDQIPITLRTPTFQSNGYRATVKYRATNLRTSLLNLIIDPKEAFSKVSACT